jgi:putative membrane protein
MMNGFGSMWFGWIFWLVILVVVIWAVIQFKNRKNNTGQSAGESSLDILKKRYANGEISKDEFDKMKKDLQ